MEIISIVPIKYESTRVPGKNFRLMNGKPLYWYIFNTLSQVSSIKRIICNTDSLKIEKMVKSDFPNVEIYHRPKHLEGGEISTNLLLLNTIETLNLIDPKYLFLQTHVTNPLLSVNTIQKAIQSFITSSKDSLFSVKQLQTRLYDSNKRAINHDPKRLIPTQSLPPVYEENSCIYIFPYSILKINEHRIGSDPFLFVMGDIESSDIDYESDFLLTEQLMNLGRKEKVIIVTGSSGGIGNSIVDFFRKKGWYTIGIDIIPSHNVDLFFSYDLTKLDNDYQKCREEIIHKFGRIDCLVNNAALQICKKWDAYETEDWEKTMNCNIRSAYLLSKVFRNDLKKTKGNIVNICSVHCISTSKNIGLYAISKSTLQGLTRSMSLEYISDGIQVNCILPGAILTPMLLEGVKRSEDPEKSLRKLKESSPAQKIGDPCEIAKAIYFFTESEYCVGSSLVIDGGASISLPTE